MEIDTISLSYEKQDRAFIKHVSKAGQIKDTISLGEHKVVFTQKEQG